MDFQFKFSTIIPKASAVSDAKNQYQKNTNFADPI
jgi:hypothetical protein